MIIALKLSTMSSIENKKFEKRSEKLEKNVLDIGLITWCLLKN